MTEIMQIITGGIGSLGFAILFNIRNRRLVAATIGGLMSWALFVLLRKFIPSEPTCYFIVALACSIYAEIMARALKSPATAFITTALIPMVPGGSLYYTMAYAFESDPEKFLERAVYTLKLASSLALGIIVAATLTKLFMKYRHGRTAAKNLQASK